MKRLFFILTVAMLISLSLVSCTSLYSDSDNYSYEPKDGNDSLVEKDGNTEYATEAKEENPQEQLYIAETYSSLYNGYGIKNWPVFVACPMDNFMLQRATETAIVKVLKEHDIPTYAYSDYANIENSISEATGTFIRYYLTVTYNDLSTYEYGGGIAELSFDCTVIDTLEFYINENKGTEDAGTIARITGASISKNNRHLSFVETIRYACTAAGKAIADEYLSYIV